MKNTDPDLQGATPANKVLKYAAEVLVKELALRNAPMGRSAA